MCEDSVCVRRGCVSGEGGVGREGVCEVLCVTLDVV